MRYLFRAYQKVSQLFRTNPHESTEEKARCAYSASMGGTGKSRCRWEPTALTIYSYHFHFCSSSFFGFFFLSASGTFLSLLLTFFALMSCKTSKDLLEQDIVFPPPLKRCVKTKRLSLGVRRNRIPVALLYKCALRSSH